MPEQLHPPYGIVQPRILNRWLDVNSQNGPLKRCETFFTIPLNEIGHEQDVKIPYIVMSFNYTATNNFSMKITSDIFTGNIFRCYLCVSFDDNESHPYIPTNTKRYLLATALGTGNQIPLTIPIEPYTNQVIKKNFTIEFWTIDDGSTLSPGELVYLGTLAPITIYTSVKQKVDYRFGQDLSLATASDPVWIDIFAQLTWVFPVYFNQSQTV